MRISALLCSSLSRWHKLVLIFHSHSKLWSSLHFYWMTSSSYLPLLHKQWKRPISLLILSQAVSYVKSIFAPCTNHYPLESPMSNLKNLQFLQIGLMLSDMVLQPTINGGTRTTLTRDCQNRILILLFNLLGILTRRNVVLPSLTDLVKSRRRIGLSNTRMVKERRRFKSMRSLSLTWLLEKKTPLIPLNVSWIILKMWIWRTTPPTLLMLDGMKILGWILLDHRPCPFSPSPQGKVPFEETITITILSLFYHMLFFFNLFMGLSLSFICITPNRHVEVTDHMICSHLSLCDLWIILGSSPISNLPCSINSYW